MVRLVDERDKFASLLDAPSPAAITVYDTDGQAVMSPVWFRATESALEVVMAQGDRKLALLREDPRCVLLVFETVPPFRGIQARGAAEVTDDVGNRTRLAIATRYLGPERGFRYPEGRPAGVVVSLPMAIARAWDLSSTIPPS